MSQIPYTATTLRPAAHLAGGPLTAERPSASGESTDGVHGAEPAAVAAAYDFTGLGTIVDVGGAAGDLLTTVLAAHRGTRGVVFDLPHAVRAAPRLIAARGLAHRATVKAGDPVAGVPAGGDVYLLSHVVRRWPEARCLAILGHCRREMRPGNRLLIVEPVVPPGDAPHRGTPDGPGGRERTELEYAGLLGRAGLRLARVVPTGAAVSVLEAWLA